MTREAAVRLASRGEPLAHRATEPRPVPGALEGTDQGLHALAELIRNHHRADVCAIAVEDPDGDDLRLYRADRDATAAARGKRVEPQSGLPALLIPRSRDGVIFNRRAPRSCLAVGTVRGRPALPRTVSDEDAARLADLIAVDSLISVPLVLRGETVGCLHVGSRRVRFGVRDLRTFTKLAEQAALMIESVRLAGRLALELAREERRRISRDLHDGTVQPYIGLKLGLEALRRKLGADAQLAGEIDELIHMAGDGIGELREYVGTLRGRKNARRRPAELVPAIRHLAQKFSDFSGIETRVLGEDDMAVSAALQDELLHIVREGLSNVRRHTRARQALVRLRRRDGGLLLEVINDRAASRTKRSPFTPRSIAERVRALGGRLEVQHRNGARTVVCVQLPL